MRKMTCAIVVMCSVVTMCCHAVEVRIRCGRAVVTGKPKEVADFGLGYLLEINPQLKDTPEWRANLVDVVLAAADGHLTLVAAKGPSLDAVWAQARKSNASIIK